LKQPIIIFDIEATCDIVLPKNKREIIEIGAVKIIDGEIVDKFQQFVKPKRNSNLSKYCMDLTHISQCDIDHANAPNVVLNEFVTWCKDAILAAWGPFDAEILSRECKKNKVVLNEDLFINIKKIFLATKHLPMETSLSDSLKMERIVFDGQQHRALDDAFNTYLIYRKNLHKMDKMMSALYSHVLRNEALRKCHA
jgi:inhibitor of KinA sporulation pathway (predicted exonuclease)